MSNKDGKPVNLPAKIELLWEENRKAHVLIQDGYAKQCPYQNEATQVKPGAKPTIGQKPCNTHCALLKVWHKTELADPNDPKSEKTVRVIATLGCSGPVSYDIAGTPEEMTSDTTLEVVK